MIYMRRSELSLHPAGSQSLAIANMLFSCMNIYIDVKLAASTIHYRFPAQPQPSFSIMTQQLVSSASNDKEKRINTSRFQDNHTYHSNEIEWSTLL